MAHDEHEASQTRTKGNTGEDLLLEAGRDHALTIGKHLA